MIDLAYFSQNVILPVLILIYFLNWLMKRSDTIIKDLSCAVKNNTIATEKLVCLIEKK